jgi:molecular chaperone DnaK
MALQRLKDAAEKAKVELSQVRETEINLPFIFTHQGVATKALHLQRTLSREKPRGADCEDLVQRTLEDLPADPRRGRPGRPPTSGSRSSWSAA